MKIRLEVDSVVSEREYKLSIKEQEKFIEAIFQSIEVMLAKEIIATSSASEIIEKLGKG